MIDNVYSKAVIVYLAGPYSNDAPKNPSKRSSVEKRLARFNAITEAARQLIEQGNIVYSPLTMTHPIDIRMKHDPGSAFWVAFDEAFMAHCSRLIVLRLPGWDASSGVSKEIDFFGKRGILPEWSDPANFGINEDSAEFAAAFD
ncbi:DUF1937 family protein [Bradyrhizobium sp. SZCCHNRI2007]|uniref:DUF1937 family protein n=1 Tax=Bradyrhizobium sp. SZCCHNRI2007 TaxID=3057281 RepID=UPI0028E21F7B|nr:DUF1937 family protein [Bradyrhizobium sp. SZCCHNRI2007]